MITLGRGILIIHASTENLVYDAIKCYDENLKILDQAKKEFPEIFGDKN